MTYVRKTLALTALAVGLFVSSSAADASQHFIHYRDLNDCGIAAAAAVVEANTGLTPTRAQVTKSSNDLGDNGVTSTVLFAYLATTGIAGERLTSSTWEFGGGADSTRAASSRSTITAAVATDGAMWAWIDDSQTWGLQTWHGLELWSVPQADGIANMPHAVAIIGTNAAGIEFVSWGERFEMTWGWWACYGGDAYAVTFASLKS